MEAGREVTSGKPWEPAGPSVARSVVLRVLVKIDARVVRPGGVALIAARPPRLQDRPVTQETLGRHR